MKHYIYFAAKENLAKQLDKSFELYEMIAKASSPISVEDYAEYVDAFWGTSWRGLRFPFEVENETGKFFLEAVKHALTEAGELAEMRRKEYEKLCAESDFDCWRELRDEMVEVIREMAQQISEIKDAMR